MLKTRDNLIPFLKNLILNIVSVLSFIFLMFISDASVYASTMSESFYSPFSVAEIDTISRVDLRYDIDDETGIPELDLNAKMH